MSLLRRSAVCVLHEYWSEARTLTHSLTHYAVYSINAVAVLLSSAIMALEGEVVVATAGMGLVNN